MQAPAERRSISGTEALTQPYTNNKFVMNEVAKTTKNEEKKRTCST
jgi:hypothetical protein